ncbi:photosystem reaction center subunit H [Elstera litoralis]|uniref:Photosystem reaction center subunit H n=1 Tax=Elstera litoralis TaxID=552518 RepID=A0A0F3IT11_9PROT|nr:PRC-barrel domain-containing protein [Elstera litoralis]KJV09683.1 photosystem reaction center subunit H [Elstera litoralis]
MKKSTIATTGLLVATLLTGSAFAQGAPQTFAPMKIDLQSLTTGYRTSKVVGAPVVNNTGETIGKVDDLIVTPNEKVPYAVLSVGGFLGVGDKLVVVPYSQLSVANGKMLLPGATIESLKALPDYKYAS